MVLGRRWWVPILTMVLATAGAGGLARVRAVSYTARAVVVVQSGASGSGPGSANEAATLAGTYAGLIPQDATIVSAVSSALHLPKSQVSKDISVTIQSGTSLLLLDFTASSPSTALRGAQLVAQAITQPNVVAPTLNPPPIAQTIPHGSVALVEMPSSARSSQSSWIKAGLLGLILGFAVGVALVAVWERADARVDVASDLADHVGFPVWDDSRLTAPLAAGVVNRWLQERSRGGTTNVVLLATGGHASGPVERLASHLEGVAARLEGGDTARLHVQVVPLRADHLVSDDLWLVNADLTVLAVQSGDRMSEVDATIQALAELGSPPGWGFVVRKSRRRARRERVVYDHAEAEDAGRVGAASVGVPNRTGSATAPGWRPDGSSDPRVPGGRAAKGRLGPSRTPTARHP